MSVEALGTGDGACCYDKYPAFTVLMEPKRICWCHLSRGTEAFYRHRREDKCWAQGTLPITVEKGYAPGHTVSMTLSQD